MSSFRLIPDGDPLEQRAYSAFAQISFPAYELFWQEFVVPLTNRPVDNNFSTDAVLVSKGKTHADLCIAQLHYSILAHLYRTVQILEADRLDPHSIVESFVRLTGALDNAFELLERFTKKASYDAWVEHTKRGGKRARKEWQSNNSSPLQSIRDYRNALVHGRLMPTVIDSGVFSLPIVGKEPRYLDWRLVTDPKNNPGFDPKEFDTGQNIVKKAFAEVCQYLENCWRINLLKGSTTVLPGVDILPSLVGPASGSVVSTTTSLSSNHGGGGS